MSDTLNEVEIYSLGKNKIGIIPNALPDINGSIDTFKLLSFLIDLQREVNDLRVTVAGYIKKLEEHENNKKVHEF
jgi:hypothetical protein